MGALTNLKKLSPIVLLSLMLSCGALDPEVNLSVGDEWRGGKIFELNVDGVSGKICALADNSAGIVWQQGGPTLIGAAAQSNTDGAANTEAIVTALGAAPNYAAGLCDAYEIDSAGNAPCLLGNECYDDWYLPASFEMAALSAQSTQRGGLIDGFASDDYKTSTEVDINAAMGSTLDTGNIMIENKSTVAPVRCIRKF